MKTTLALQIIAGVRPGWAHWKSFFPDVEAPKYHRSDTSGTFNQHRDMLNIQVRNAACEFIAERLNDE